MSEISAGRDAELSSLRDFVRRISDGAVGFVLEGEAGMGKTTLWRAAVEHAEEVGLLVLQAQPVESETARPSPGSAICSIPCSRSRSRRCPPVQRRALSRALALDDNDRIH